MTNIETFANENVDNVMRPLHVGTATGPVLATPAYAGYAAVAFTAGIISDAVEHHGSAEAAPTEPVPDYGSVDQLLGMRVDSIS